MAEQNKTDANTDANNPISSGMAPGPGEHLLDPELQASLAASTQSGHPAERPGLDRPTYAYDESSSYDANRDRQGRNASSGTLFQSAQDRMRRSPAAFVIGAIATGFVAQRFLKSRSESTQRATWPFPTTQWDASRTGYGTDTALRSERKYGLETAYAPDTANDAGAAYGSRLGSTAGRLTDRVRQAGEDVRARLQSTTADAKTRLNDAAAMTKQQVYQAKDRMVAMKEEQPLLIAALGIAVGAGLGALLPVTRRESALLGGARDNLMDKTKEVAKTQFETLKSSAQRFADITKEEAQRVKDELAAAASRDEGAPEASASAVRKPGAGSVATPGTTTPGATGASGSTTGLH